MSIVQMLFLQSCPICGRTLCVPVERMGQSAGCRYCGASFVAASAAGGRKPARFFGTLSPREPGVSPSEAQSDDSGSTRNQRSPTLCSTQSTIADTMFAIPTGRFS
jgi:hypothetical protein